MGFKSKLTTLHIAYSVQVKSSFHRSIMLGPSWVCNLNHWKNNALSPPQYCIGVTPQQCVSFFLPMPRTPL